MYVKVWARDLAKGGWGRKEDTPQFPPGLFSCLRFLSSILRTRLTRSLENRLKLYGQENLLISRPHLELYFSVYCRLPCTLFLMLHLALKTPKTEQWLIQFVPKQSAFNTSVTLLLGSITSRCSGNKPVLLPENKTRPKKAAETGAWTFPKLAPFFL